MRQRRARPARPQLSEGRSPPPGSDPTGSTGWPTAAGRSRRASGDTEPFELSELTGARSGSDHRPAGKGLYGARPVSGGAWCRHLAFTGKGASQSGKQSADLRAPDRSVHMWWRAHRTPGPPTWSQPRWPVISPSSADSSTRWVICCGRPPRRSASCPRLGSGRPALAPDPRRRRRGSAPCTACWTAARPCGWRAMRSMAKSALAWMRGGEAVGVHDVEDVSGAARPQGTGHRMDVAGDPPAWARLGPPSRAGLPTRAPPRFRPGRCRSGRPRRVWRDVRRPSRSPPASCRHRRPPSGPSRWCRVRRR